MVNRKTVFLLTLAIALAAAAPSLKSTSDLGETKNQVEVKEETIAVESTGRGFSSRFGVFGRAFRSSESLVISFVSRLFHVFGGVEGLLKTGLRRMGQEDMRGVINQLDRVMVLYMRAVMEEEECQERFTCEAGEMIGGYFGSPVKQVMRAVEPIVPDYLRKILASFRMGVKDGTVCRRMACETETYAFFKTNETPMTELDQQLRADNK